MPACRIAQIPRSTAGTSMQGFIAWHLRYYAAVINTHSGLH